MRYRVSWSASSNVTFSGSDDWQDWDDPKATTDEIEEALTRQMGGISDGLEIALEGSGFEWWVEVEDGPAGEATV